MTEKGRQLPPVSDSMLMKTIDISLEGGGGIKKKKKN